MRSLIALEDVGRHNGGLVTRDQAMAAGVRSQRLTELVRTGAIARVARGVYAVAAEELARPDPAATALSCRGVLSQLSAAAWWGVDMADPVRRLSVAVPRNRGRRADAIPGVRLHRADLLPHEVVVVRGTRVTTPLRTALDLARQQPLEVGVTVIDSFLRAGLLRITELELAVSRLKGPYRCRAQLVATLVDPRAGSVLESMTRMLMWRAGLPPPQSQHPFRHLRTGWIGYLDFAWPEAEAALESDGYEFHDGRDAFQHDRRRWTALNRAGWRLAVVTWFDVTRDPQYVVAAVRDLLGPPRLPGVEHTTGTDGAAAAAA